MYWDAEEPKEMPSSESLPVVGFRTQCSQSEITKLRAENERLKAELAEKEKDAERYRWLRSEHERIDPVASVSWKIGFNRSGHDWCNTVNATNLDTCIDQEAMKGK